MHIIYQIYFYTFAQFFKQIIILITKKQQSYEQQ